MPTLPITRTSNDPALRNIPNLVLPVSIVALRAEAYSSNGKNIIISLATKYSSAERIYSVPLECFHDLIVDLQRLNAVPDTTSN
jgi:hypothetical protein